jgi:cytoskeleton protein RodZ
MSEGAHSRSDATPGSVLALARREHNLSVVDVARHLKLSPAQVEALEAGAYERLPGPVFVRGFLRNYAKLLGIDPQPLLRSIDSQSAQPAIADRRPHAPQVVMEDRPSRWPLYTVLVAALIVGVLAIYEFGFNEPPQPAQPAGGESSAAPTVDSAQPQSAAESAGPVAVASAPLSGGATGEPPTLDVQPAPTQADAAAAAPAPQKARPGERELYFKFDEDSWVEVRDRDDRVVFSRLNQAGTEERVNARPPVKLVVGNARGVRLNYDDQPVDLAPHTGVTVARLTLQ